MSATTDIQTATDVRGAHSLDRLVGPLPCPHCRATAAALPMSLARDQWAVCCSALDCLIGPSLQTKRRAIKAWNNLPRGTVHIETSQLHRQQPAKAPTSGRELQDGAMRPNTEVSEPPRKQ